MKCPRCSSELKQQQQGKGVEIDVCPQCQGVWLDRGELERLTAAEDAYYRRDDGGDGDSGDDGRVTGGGGRPKKRGFFQNLMDNLGDIGG